MGAVSGPGRTARSERIAPLRTEIGAVMGPWWKGMKRQDSHEGHRRSPLKDCADWWRFRGVVGGRVPQRWWIHAWRMRRRRVMIAWASGRNALNSQREHRGQRSVA